LCRTLQNYRSVVTSAEVCDTPNGAVSLFSTQLAQQRGLVQVVDEGLLAVDLDDREPLAVAGLELVVPGDVDRLVGDPERVELLPRTLAERAVRRVEEDDGYG
jgi:hypothetical protein